MRYGGANVDVKQNVGDNAQVSFQTGRVISDSGTAVKYYAGGWKAFSSGIELLPGQYTFRFNDGTADTRAPVAAATENHIH